MKHITLLFIGAILFSIASCSSEPGLSEYDEYFEAVEAMEEEEEVDTTPVNITWDDLKSGKLKEGQVVILKCYIDPLGNTKYSSGSSSSFYISPRRNGDHKFRASVSLPLGTGENEIYKMPNEYYHTDLKVTTIGGEIAGVSSHVEIKGFYDPGYSPEDNCTIDLMEITLLDFDATVLDEAVELTDELLNEKFEGTRYVYMDMILSMRNKFVIGEQNFMLSVDPISNSEVKSILCQVGYWPGTKSDAEGSYLIDMEGNLIGEGEKIRAYGTYEQRSIGSGTFNLEEVIKL